MPNRCKADPSTFPKDQENGIRFQFFREGVPKPPLTSPPPPPPPPISALLALASSNPLQKILDPLQFGPLFCRSQADRIKCYQCTPDPVKGETCQHPTNSTTCERFHDSCWSLTASGKRNPTGGRKMTSAIMGCSTKQSCIQLQQKFCDAANSTGMLTECSMDCCQEDLCNDGGPSTTEPSTNEDTATPPQEGRQQSTGCKERSRLSLTDKLDSGVLVEWEVVKECYEKVSPKSDQS